MSKHGRGVPWEIGWYVSMIPMIMAMRHDHGMWYFIVYHVYIYIYLSIHIYIYVYIYIYNCIYICTHVHWDYVGSSENRDPPTPCIEIRHLAPRFIIATRDDLAQRWFWRPRKAHLTEESGLCWMLMGIKKIDDEHWYNGDIVVI